MNDIRTQVDFSIIRYANCWEDADVLLQALQLPPQSNICCIASAGDNALALLSTNPKQLTAFDISAVQLHLTELKKGAFQLLSYDELLPFIGVKQMPESERLQLFDHIQPLLSNPAADYWNANRKTIAKGVIGAGKFEHYFRLFRNWFLPLVHSSRTVQQLLQPKTAAEQKTFYHSTWNNRRWQILMAVFFSKAVMGKYGRDPQFLKQVQVPVSQFVREKAATHLQSAYSTQNAFLQMIFTGNYQYALPFYLRRENFETIKGNLHKLQIVQADAKQVIEQQPYDAYCLSNIFEYMPAAQFEILVNDWRSKIPQGSKLAFWNLMAPRSFAETTPEAFCKKAVSERLLQKDWGFFYNRFCLEEKR